MDINVVSQKPKAHKLCAKIDPEIAELDMELATLPDDFGNVAMNLCVVSPARPKTVTAGGILLTHDTLEATEYAQQLGRIEKVGHFFYKHGSYKDIPKDEAPQVGDFVLFAPYSGRRFNLNGDDFIILQEKDILVNKVNPHHKFKLFT